jgi:glycosyl transferase, family 25
MKKSLPIKVISLERAGRREGIAHTLLAHGVDFSFVDAVDAQEFQAGELASLYDDAAARSRYGRSLSEGEVACFLSHRRLWQEVANSGHSAIVLEDDALLESDFFDRVVPWPEEKLARLADVVLLGRSKLSKSAERRTYLCEPLKCAERIAGMNIGSPFKQWTSGAVGYWISARGATRALAHSAGPIRALLDDWPWHRDEGGMIIKEARPYVVWEAFETMTSELEGRRRQLTPVRSRWRNTLLAPLRVFRLAARWSVVALIVAAESAGMRRATRHD